MTSRKKNKSKLTKGHRSRLSTQHKEHNRRLKQLGRHDECLTFDEYVNYVFGKKKVTSTKSKTHYCPPSAYRRNTPEIPSLGHGVGNASRNNVPEYTGNYVKGIATMHKSNLVPVANDEHAKDISRMRR